MPTAVAQALPVITQAGIDVVALMVLVGWLYRRRAPVPEMPFVLAALNIGLFAALTAISAGSFPTGVGFGLFGLLSLVRLRSTAFTLNDVAYTFVALVLALVTGLPERQLWLVAALSVGLLVTVLIFDESRTQPATRRMRLTLDQVYLDPGVARARVSDLLGFPVLGVVIDDIDLVRETTRVSVRYPVTDDDGWTDSGTLDEALRRELA